MATFSRLLFLGQEWSLWQLDLLVFAFVDMLANDYVLAAVIAALVAWVRPLSLVLFKIVCVCVCVCVCV